MIKFKTGSLSFASSTGSNEGIETARRLVVLFPNEADYTAATRRVWELAHALDCDILFLSLCAEEVQEASVRRQLITMAAMVQDASICAEVRVQVGSNWVNAIRRSVQDGDMIVCFDEQRTGLLHKPLGQILRARLDVPVYVLSGLYGDRVPRANWLSSLMAWTGSIAIIVGSFVVQIRLTFLPQDWTQATLLIVSVIGEIWLIWGWNNLFG